MREDIRGSLGTQFTKELGYGGRHSREGPALSRKAAVAAHVCADGMGTQLSWGWAKFMLFTFYDFINEEEMNLLNKKTVWVLAKVEKARFLFESPTVTFGKCISPVHEDQWYLLTHGMNTQAGNVADYTTWSLFDIFQKLSPLTQVIIFRFFLTPHKEEFFSH